LVTAFRSGEAKPEDNYRVRDNRCRVREKRYRVRNNHCRVRRIGRGYASQNHGYHHSQEPFVALGGSRVLDWQKCDEGGGLYGRESIFKISHTK